MEVDNERYLDVIDYRRRVLPSVQVYSSIVEHPPTFSLPTSGFVRSSRITSGKECSRKGNQSQVSGILQSPLFSSQKERQLETCYRSVSPKQVHYSREIQDGDFSLHQECYPNERLGSLLGSNRRLLSYNDKPVLEEIPAFHSKRRSTPVQGPSLRDCVSTKDLYEDHGESWGLLAHARTTTTPVFRRLAPSQRESCQSSGRSVSHMAYSHQTGAYSKPPKIGTDPYERVYVRRDDIPHRSRFSTSPIDENRIRYRDCLSVSGQNNSDSSLYAVTAGVSQCSSRPYYSGPAAYETSSIPVPRSVEAICRPVGSGNSYVRRLQVPSGMVAEQVCVCKGCPLVYSHSRPVSFHRCQFNGMGGASGTFRPDGSRNMDNQRELSSHKQSRVESCLSCSDTVCYCCNVQNRTACYRQHDCSVLHSKTRGDTFPTIVSGDLEASQLVSVNVNSTTSQTCARETQCFSRRVVPSEQDFTCGMDTETRDSSNPISVVRNSDGRSVCNQTKSSSTTVCVANTRPSSLGSRCAISKLEPTVRVRFSTVQSDSGSTRKNSTVTPVQNYSNSALLASEIMVQPASELPCGLTDSPSSSGRSVISVSGSSSTHEPRDATSSRLDVIKRSVRENNFSEKVASRIAQSRRTSTRNVYDAKWRVFSYWCKSKSIDPQCPTMNNLASYFLFLFEEKKLAVSTIKGYRSMLSNTLKFKGGEKIGSDPFLSELMRSFELDRPVIRSLTPKWDLSCVLWSLTKEPYEPLTGASLKFLTLKTVFLLAFATARRRSEIHAFSIEEGCLRFNKSDGSVSLLCQPGFLAKNQLPQVLPEPIYVPSLSKSCGHDDPDRLLCPVRSLKFYLKRVETSRGSRKRLFLPLIGNKDISAATVSRWTSDVIKFAYQGLSDRDLSFLQIRPHEVRALSASWAFLNRSPLEDVLRAAYWKNSSTFSSFYLRSFAAQADNLHSLGPLVASQRVIK